MLEHIFSADFTIQNSVWISLIVITGYFLSRCVYNLYFHPLRKFPGPKVAAIGSFLEFYYDVVKDGTYLWQIEKMHLKYGPIVRVNARELHILDPHFYKDIYAGSSRRVDKHPEAVAAYTVPQAVLATVDHDLHRVRRGLLSSYFSKRSIVGLEPTIHERISRLCTRLEECKQQAQVVDLDSAFAALTADIVTCYFYGSHLDCLGNKSFKFAMRDAILGLIGFYHVTRFLPTLASTIKKLPIAVVQLINPGAADMLRFQAEIERNVQSSLDDDDDDGDGDEKSTKPKAVIVEALKDSNIPPEERTIHRMVDEGTTIIFAGTETTARALSVSMFHLLNNKLLLQELRKELMSLPPVEDHAYQLSQLETLPYLTGVVNEGLRLSHGPVIRLPRVAATEALRYKDYVIPPGTPVSQLTYLVHMDPSIFPNPHSFDPTRWIRAAQEGVKLEKFLVSFTKGSRVCLGINLAYAEIYLTVARIALSFNMELHDTTQDDLDIHHIRLTGYPKKGMGEVKVLVIEKIDAKLVG